jgi:transglutaminase-like putative cysteine protease
MAKRDTRLARMKTLVNRLIQLFLYGAGILLTLVSLRLQTWTLASFALLAFLMAYQFGRAKAKGSQPEDSRRLRTLAYAAQVCAMASLAWATGLWWLFLPCAALLYGGHQLAYRHRATPRWTLRIGGFVALHLVFVWMFFGMFSGLPNPQAQAAMLATVAVSASQRSRMNLFSGIGLGLANLYVAATLARDLSFLVFLGAFVALLLAFLWRADDEEGLKQNQTVLRITQSPRGHMPSPLIIRSSIALVAIAGLIFVFTPRFAGHPLVPPFTLNAPIRSAPTGQIINPAVPLVQVAGSTSSETGDYYAGFSSTLDLSYRSGLSDDIMMYVRSAAPSYWRSHAYDTYDGRTWMLADETIQRISSRSGIFPLEDFSFTTEQVFAQTYQIVRPLPNLVFTAGKPVNLYLAASEIARDAADGIRVGEPLSPNTVYSVVSVENRHTPVALRAADGETPDEITARYLPLPASVTQRTRDLAAQIVAESGANTRYDVAKAIETYLRTNYAYTYFPPPQPPSSDAVDVFLFEDRRGMCALYASSMAVMLRTLDIPARVVAGFGTGDFNAFTNLYEVRANDAHAWVEVYFPTLGWVPFEPTAGWNGDPQTGTVQRWLFSGALGGLELPSIPTEQIASISMGILSIIAPWLLMATLIVAVWFVLRRLRPRWARLGWRLPAFGGRSAVRDPARRAIFAQYRRAQRKLRIKRAPGETVREQAQAAPSLVALATLVETAAYRPQPPTPDDIAAAKRWRNHPAENG